MLAIRRFSLFCVTASPGNVTFAGEERSIYFPNFVVSKSIILFPIRYSQRTEVDAWPTNALLSKREGHRGKAGAQ